MPADPSMMDPAMAGGGQAPPPPIDPAMIEQVMQQMEQLGSAVEQMSMVIEQMSAANEQLMQEVSALKQEALQNGQRMDMLEQAMEAQPPMPGI